MSGRTGTPVRPADAQAVGAERKSMARTMPSVSPVPKSSSALATRMSRTEGATPASRGSTNPLPRKVPAVWVP